MKYRAKFLILVITVLSLTTLTAADVVINTGDWRGASIGIAYSHFAEEDPHIVTNLGEGKLIASKLSENETHTLLESGSAVWADYGNYMESNDLKKNKINFNWKNSQRKLYERVKEDVKGFVVVKPGYGIDTISVFPKVVNSNYWLTYYQGHKTIEFLKKKDKPVLFYGEYTSQPWKKLNSEKRDIRLIDKGTKERNNREMVSRLMEEYNHSAMISAGDYYIEKGFVTKGSPIYLGDTVESTANLIEKHNISLIEVIGAENVDFGNSIKDRFGENITVIAKFGRRFTGVKGLEGTYPLKKVSVKPVEREVKLVDVVLDKREGTDALKLVFSNKGNIPTKLNFSAVQIGTGTNTEIISDSREVLIRENTNISLVFPVNVSFDASEAEVSFDYLDKAGLASQQYDVKERNFQSKNNIKMTDLVYSKSDQEIVLKVENKENSSVWVDAQLDDLNILNRTLDVLAEDSEMIKAGEKGKLRFNVYLDGEEISENRNVTVGLVSGGREGMATDYAVKNVRMDVKTQFITGSFFKGTVSIVLLLFLISVGYYFGLFERFM